MTEFKTKMIEALKNGDLEQVKLLKPEFEEEAAREKWLDSHFKNGGVPVSAWLEPNPFLMFVEPDNK